MNQAHLGRILLIEDEARVAAFVEKSLSEAGYQTSTASTASRADEFWRGGQMDLVILDLMLPDEDGLGLLKRKRDSGDLTPVLVVSAKGSMAERVTGLDAGADDYLAKPFGIEELLARVRVLIRRKRLTEPTISCGD